MKASRLLFLALLLLIQTTVTDASAQRLKEKITIEKNPNGNIGYVKKNIYEYLSGITCVTQYEGPKASKTALKGKEESHIQKQGNTTDSIVEHFNYKNRGEFVRDKITTYSFDGKGRLISQKTEHVDSVNPVYPQKLITEFSYDRDGRVKKIMQGSSYNSKSKRFEKHFISHITYESNSIYEKTYFVLHYNNHLRKYLLLDVTSKSLLNEQGQIILSEKKSPDSDELDIIKYQYDEHGHTSREEHYCKGLQDSVDLLTHIYEYEYKYYPVGAQQLQDKENVHEYVDLGLSVNWATCNVGADKPEDYGDYFAWGETEPKSEYTWENYKYRHSGDED